MPTTAEPVLRNWYQDLETQLSFRVIAIDESGDSIEVQYLNGDVGEFDFETWYASAFDPIEAPEDWSAPYDDIVTDDLGYSDPDIHAPAADSIDINDLVND